MTRYSTSISIPSAATTGIEIVFTVGAQTSGTWTIGDAQLEPGAVATPFERRSFGQELALCQRYFFSGTTSSSLNPTTVTTNISVVGNFPVVMRATPSIAGITASFSSPLNVTAFFNTAGSSWAGGNAYTASAEL